MSGTRLLLVLQTMRKKNSSEPTRIRLPKSSGKPSGRGFTGHRGRGRGRSFGYEFDEQVGMDERPDSVVDDDSDAGGGEESEDASEGLFEASVNFYIFLTCYFLIGRNFRTQ